MNKYNFKRLLLPLYILCLIFLISGCNIETPEEHDNRISNEDNERASILEELLSSNNAPSEESTASEPSSSSVESSPQTDGGVTETNGSVPSYSGTIEPSQQPSSGTTSDTTKQNNPTTDNSTSAEAATIPADDNISQKYILVHIKIICSKVIGDENLSTSASLPDDGIILDTPVAIKSGSSVFTALETVLNDNDISINYTGTKNSVYVSGIGGLNEKDCGRYSGWKYSVNDIYSNVGCGAYILRDGDSILWGYVADYKDTY